jgi:DNA primase
MYDRFRGRIMFPISDSSGRVIAFSGRLLEVGLSAEALAKAGAKYLNSPETPIFKKSAVLYGLDKAKQSIKKNDFSIVVEGQFDLILSHQAGFRNTVATSGTALVDKGSLENNTINNLGLISRLSQNIIFVFDADKAGFAASIRATPIAMALFSDMNVKAAQMPEGMDPADLISKKGPDAWHEVIRNSKHIIEFLLDKVLVGKNNDRLKIKLEINDKIVPFLSLINNPVKKSHFISMVSNKSGISENDIREKLKKIEQELKYEKMEISENKETIETLHRKDYIERKLLGIAFWKKDKKLEKSLGQILEKYKDSGDDLIFEAEVFYGNSENLEKDIGELLANLEEEKINEELLRKMQELRIIKDKDRERELLSAIQKLNKQKHEKKK